MGGDLQTPRGYGSQAMAGRQATLSRFFARKTPAVAPAAAPATSPSTAEPSEAERDRISEGLPSMTHASIDLTGGSFPSSAIHRKRVEEAINHHFGADEAAAPIDDAPTSMIGVALTPLEKQVVQLKGRHPDCVLMIECGYRTRFFGEDARIASSVLGIHARISKSFLVTSFPTHRSLFHCRRLIAAGHKVAMVRQQETAALRKSKAGPTKATFERAVAGIFTAGTMIDEDDPAFRGICRVTAVETVEEDEDDDEAEDEEVDIATDTKPDDDGCWITSIYEDVDAACAGIAAVDVLSNKVGVIQLPLDPIRQGIRDHLDSLQCAEVVVNSSCSKVTLALLNDRKQSSSSGPEQVRYLKRLESVDDAAFQLVDPPEWVGDMPPVVVRALGGLKEYLRTFGLQNAVHSAEVTRMTPAASGEEEFFHLDAVTVRDLEVFHAQGGKGKHQHSLFKHIDSCRTSYGRKTLRSWLACPLSTRQAILDRQAVVTALLSVADDSTMTQLLKRCHEVFQKYPDVERALALLQHGRISLVRFKLLLQLGQLVSELQYVVQASAAFPPLLQSWLCSIQWEEIGKQSASFWRRLCHDDTDTLTGIFSSLTESSIPELALLKSELELAGDCLNDALAFARRALHLPALQFSSLRTGASKLENLIEVPVSFARPIPDSWTKVSSTKQVMRFHSPEILSAQNLAHCARDKIKIAGESAWQRFVEEAQVTLLPLLRSAVQALAKIDAASSLAVLARRPGYTCPLYPEGSDEVMIAGGKHPVLSRGVEDSGGSFVPNDVHLRRNFLDRSCQVVTGPNMGGKSSYVRMVALMCLLGQIGSFVPASAASLCVYDNIFTRMGAEDDLSSGRSTFMCELVRVSNIVQKASPRSLVIVDELGRGTSTHDGCAIALATLKHIVLRVGCTMLFITHFPQVGEFVDSGAVQARAFNTHMSFVEGASHEDHEVVFLYSIVEGASKGSYGINVARLAGLPPSVLSLAVEKSNWMLAKTKLSDPTDPSAKRPRLGGGSVGAYETFV